VNCWALVLVSYTKCLGLFRWGGRDWADTNHPLVFWMIDISRPGRPDAVGVSINIRVSLADLNNVRAFSLLVGELLQRLDEVVALFAKKGLDQFPLRDVGRRVFSQVGHDLSHGCR